MAFLYFTAFSIVFVFGMYGVGRFFRARGYGTQLDMLAEWIEGSRTAARKAAIPAAAGLFRAKRGLDSMPLFGSKSARNAASDAITFIERSANDEKTPGPGKRHV